ncbi:MAG: anti-sigma factor [Bacteroidota bacterium]
MDVEKYIASGVLELYVSGALSPQENEEVQSYARQYPEIQKEIETIEATILDLTKKASPGMPPTSFESIASKINSDNSPTIVLDSTPKNSWVTFLGWAASVVLAVGLIWTYLQNDELKSDIEVTNKTMEQLEDSLSSIKLEIADKESILEELRNKDVSVILLQGQQVSPTSYTKVFWNASNEVVTIDAQGLPSPPEGYDYQVWSLTLNPLTPTSIGLLSDFNSNKDKLFSLENANESQAFGITLEPEGGSETPTLEQLYTLGTVEP